MFRPNTRSIPYSSRYWSASNCCSCAYSPGPSFNLLTDTSNKSGKEGVSFNSSVTKSAVAFQVGAGVEIGKFNIDIRYDGQFKKPVQTFTFGKNYTETVKTKMNSWQLNLGYFF